MEGVQQVMSATRGLLRAIRDEGAGPLVTQAAGELGTALFLSSDDDLRRPIARIGFYSNSGTPAQLSTLDVAALMDENAAFEESAWLWITQLLREGVYDDSDLRSGVLVIYMADDREALAVQAREWAQANPQIVADKDLDLGLLGEPA